MTTKYKENWEVIKPARKPRKPQKKQIELTKKKLNQRTFKYGIKR